MNWKRFKIFAQYCRLGLPYKQGRNTYIYVYINQFLSSRHIITKNTVSCRVVLSLPQSILCGWFPAHSNRERNHISDREFPNLKCWWQNCALHRHIRTSKTTKTNTYLLHFITTIFLILHWKEILGVNIWGSSNLKCTASCYSFVCIECGADVFAEELGDPLFDSWDPCGSSNYLHCTDIIPTQLCQTKHTHSWADSSFV